VDHKRCLSRPTPALEQYHNTPETQTEESYTHPEDLEHFANHETIEITEAEREAIYQGITVEEALAQHRNPAVSEEHPAQRANTDNQDVPKKIERPISPELQDPAVRFREAKADSKDHGEWGAGEAGYRVPKSASERMRKNVPYKVMSHSVLRVSAGG
jgi:nucleobindin